MQSATKLNLIFTYVLSMAVDFPLILYDCHFDGLTWKQEPEEVNYILVTLQQHWTQSAVKSHLLLGMITALEAKGKRDYKSSYTFCFFSSKNTCKLKLTFYVLFIYQVLRPLVSACW